MQPLHFSRCIHTVVPCIRVSLQIAGLLLKEALGPEPFAVDGEVIDYVVV